MKSLSELRFNFNLNPQEQSTSVKFLKRNKDNIEIDFDVYLPSIGKNLQRDFVWGIEQKRELILSMLIDRHIPHIAIVNKISDKDYTKDKYLIIDGKQRISTAFDFIDDKFTLLIDNKEYLYSELPEDYQRKIDNFYFRTYMVNENKFNEIKDIDLINWFKFINFAGTLQEKEHLESLKCK
jgi:uncharacterized protein with ParB-like and HNH nuclease domain